MAKKEDVPVVTEADVQQAWADFETAKAEVESLRKRFVDGDESVSQSDIASQRGVVEWLEMVAERTEGQRDRYNTSERQNALAELSADLKSFDMGNQYEAQGRGAADAITKFIESFIARNEQLTKFRQRAVDLGVPAWSPTKFPSVSDAYLEYGDGSGTYLKAGDREFNLHQSGVFLHQLIAGVYAKISAERPGIARTYFFPNHEVSSTTLDEVYKALAAVDAEQSASTADSFYYRHAEWSTPNPNANPVVWKAVAVQGGSVFRFEKEMTEEDARRGQLVRISEQEARGDV
jgi:hypothetical protein